MPFKVLPSMTQLPTRRMCLLRVHSLVSITTPLSVFSLQNLETDLCCKCTRVHVTVSYILQVKCVCGEAQHASSMLEVHKTISNVAWSLYVPCLKRTCSCSLVCMPGSQAWDHLGVSYLQLYFLQRSPALMDVGAIPDSSWILGFRLRSACGYCPGFIA